MSNPYLEKAASIYEFWNDFTGKEHNELKARKNHLEKALANGDTVEGLSSKIKNTGIKTYRARGRVGAVAAGLTVAGLIGTKKYTDHQEEIATNNLRNLYMMQKHAGVIDAIKSVAKSAPVKAATKAVTGTAKYTGKKVLNTLNTAHGGKVKQFGLDTFGKSTPAFDKFVKADRATQKSYVTGANLDKLKKLHTQQRVAKAGVYGGAAAISLNYSQSKKRAQQQNIASPYYYQMN